jgi:hypothetical protein
MNASVLHRFTAPCLVAVLSLTLNSPLRGEIHSKLRDLAIDQPSDLPELARNLGDACFLYQDNAGQTYLYIEQQHGARLAVLDVSDPAHIKLASSTALTVPGPFDFMRPLNDHLELIRFRDNRGVAVLNLRKAKNPVLGVIGNAPQTGSTEALSESVVLMEKQSGNELLAVPRDLQIVDISAPAGPVVLATIKQVTQKTVNPETGTTFLLGSDGLTVIRHTQTENDRRLRLALQASN